MNRIPGWSTLAAVIALTALAGISASAKPAMARPHSQNYDNRSGGAPYYPDQNAPGWQGQSAQGYGYDQRSGDDRGYGDNGYARDGNGDWRDGNGDRGGNWNDRDRGAQCQDRRWSGGRGGRGHWGRNADWRRGGGYRGGWESRGGCNN